MSAALNAASGASGTTRRASSQVRSTATPSSTTPSPRSARSFASWSLGTAYAGRRDDTPAAAGSPRRSGRTGRAPPPAPLPGRGMTPSSIASTSWWTWSSSSTECARPRQSTGRSRSGPPRPRAPRPGSAAVANRGEEERGELHRDEQAQGAHGLSARRTRGATRRSSRPSARQPRVAAHPERGLGDAVGVLERPGDPVLEPREPGLAGEVPAQEQPGVDPPLEQEALERARRSCRPRGA